MIQAQPYTNNGKQKIDVVRNVTVFFCGRCEREFLAKLKPGQVNPTYECPRCKSANKFDVTWK